jgi:RNA polymerase sigma-70 factor (ECF subfamily)
MTADAAPTSDSDYAQHFIEQAMPFLDQLYSGARRLTASQYDAEDLVQETILSGFKGFRLYREGTNLRAWLFRIMYNTWVGGYRARQSRPTEVLCDEFTDAHLTGGGRVPIGLRSAEVEALERMPDDDIVAALDQLPEILRMTVYFAVVEGYRYREIATMTNVPVGTVMSRLARGRRRLRELLVDVSALHQRVTTVTGE